jgi:serine protease
MNVVKRGTGQSTLFSLLPTFMALLAFCFVVCEGSIEPLSASVSASGEQVCETELSHTVEVSWVIGGGVAPYAGSITITAPTGGTEVIADVPSEGTRVFDLATPGGGTASVRVDVTDSDGARSSATVHVILHPCVGEGAPPDELPPFDYTIDLGVRPIQQSVNPYGDGISRPVAAVKGPNGQVSSFVENEVVVQTHDPGFLARFLARYAGRVIWTIDPAIAGLDHLAPIHVVRVDPETASLDSFKEHVTAISEANGRIATGFFRFSSERGARLMALAMAEAFHGHPVGINWVGGGHPIPTSTTEGPSDIPGYTPDAYQWDHFRSETPQDIGVPDAWSLLFHSGSLSNTVTVAVLDGGFSPNEDLDPWKAESTVYGTSALDSENSMTCGGSDCPWHGSGVWSTAMAVPDNAFGAAGTAGPVSRAIVVYVGADLGSWTTGILVAKAEGAQIINLSLGMTVPQIFDPTLMISEDVFEAVHDDNTLIFAAAGNDGTDVDGEVCGLVGWPIPIERCFEDTWYMPCENNGVICVGGLGWNSQYSDGSSNYGRDSVDIYAPFSGFAAPDPEFVDAADPAFRDGAHWFTGTSHASPYAAGVAALIWAADPSLSADDVWNIMQETAHSRYPGASTRWVNAHDAVQEALGEVLFVEIDLPLEGTTLSTGIPVELGGRVTFIGEPGHSAACTVTWSSSLDGLLHSQEMTVVVGPDGSVTQHAFATVFLMSEGDHVIELSAQTADPSLAAADDVHVSVGNVPPTVRIIAPPTGTGICQGELVTLRGTAWDPDRPGELLPDANFVWTTTIGSNPVGVGRVVSTDALLFGVHTITLTVTDADFLTGRGSIELRVHRSADPECAGNLGPRPTIVHPENGARYRPTLQDSSENYYELITLEAIGNDDHDTDEDLLFMWYVNGRYVGTGRVLHNVIVYASTSPRTIRVEAVDSEGASGEDQIEIIVELMV